MAKAAQKPASKGKGVAVVERKSTALAKNNVDVSLLREQDAGVGVSTDAADNIVPLIYVLQAQSPQCLKQKPEYIKGAEAGMFWPRGSKDLWEGEEEGIRVVPAHFSKCWVEWKPDRGGFVARHAERPEVAEQVKNPKDPEQTIWVMPSGNVLNESREFIVMVLDKFDSPSPFVVSFTGSNHTAARAWMSLINRKQTPKGNKASIFEYVYEMKTVAKSNDKGDWYGITVDDTDERTSDDTYLLARNLAMAVGTGAMKPAAPDETVDGDGTSDDDAI